MLRRTAVRGIAALVLGAAVFGATPVAADVLLIDRVRTTDVPLPARGISMAQVESQFGTPVEKRAPVGGGHPQRPPITRWVYPQFSVYFEHDHVVDAVVNQASPLETGPKPVR